MTVKYVNNFRTTLVTSVLANATSFVLSSVDGLPTIVTGGEDKLYLTLENTNKTEREIVLVTNIDTGTKIVTVTRGQDGTTPMAWVATTTVEARLNAQALRESLSPDNITYTAPITDAVERTIKSKFSDVVSITDFDVVGDGVADDSDAVEAFIAAGGGIIPANCWLAVSRTIIIGNDVVITGAGSKLCGFVEHSSFVNTGNMPLFALNASWANTTYNTYDVDNVMLRGFTIRGTSIAVDGNNVPTADSGTRGIDVTWTKDNIIIEDIGFERLYEGVGKIDSARSDVVHWGLKIRDGYVYKCRKAYNIFPSTGLIDAPDIQGTPYGVYIGSSNATSSNMSLNLRRVEVNRSYTTPADGYLVYLKSVKSEISGYFEGNSRHIIIEGGNNSQTVIKPSQFSAVNSGGTGGALNGVPIYMNTTGSASSLTIIGNYGVYTGNMDAFIETSAACETAGAKIFWLGGQGGNSSTIFKWSDGSKKEYPPLTIKYFNMDNTRGYVNTPGVIAYAMPMLWSGASSGFYNQTYIRRINNYTATGTYDVLTITGHCHGTIRASLQDNSSKGSSTYYLHQVWEFFCQDDGTIIATPVVSTPNGGALGAKFQITGNKIQQVIQNVALTTCALEISITSEAVPDTILTWA